MVRRIAIVASVVWGLLAAPVAGQDATPAAGATRAASDESGNPFEGLVGDAGRSFDCVGDAFPPGRISFAFGVLRFGTEANAARYTGLFRRALTESGETHYGLIIRGVVAEWFSSEGSVDGSTYRIGTLLLRDGVDLHFWFAISATGDPRGELGQISGYFQDEDLRPAGVPATSPLLDRLPGADDMAHPCVLTSEEADVLVGSGPRVIGMAMAGTQVAATPGP